MKLTRNSMAGTAGDLPVRNRHVRQRRGREVDAGASGSITRRASGPCTAITAHCSVVEVSHTASSGHSVWR